MKALLLAALLSGASVTAVAAAECPITEIEAALAEPLAGMQMISRPVTDIQSTEGGGWGIYRTKLGTLHSIVRVDGGESGMSERRISIVSDEAYGIAVTRVDYLRHAFIDGAGPNGTAKRSTEYFYFCGGRLLVPPADYATLDTAAYAKAGDKARKAMMEDKDLADLTKDMPR